MKNAIGNRAGVSASELAALFGFFLLVAAAIFFFAFPRTSAAAPDYVCQCVNGELAAIVSGNIAVNPVCAPRTCPAPTSSLPAARSLQASAKSGGSDCAPQQVMDLVSGQYEWKVLCR